MANKKTIIFSSYDDIDNPYYAGGGAVAIHSVAKRLTKFFTVIVITGNYKSAKNRKKENVIYKRVGFSFFGPKLGQLFFHFLLPFYVKTQKFDLWIESFTPPFSTSCLQLFTKKPVIGLVHMLSGEDMQRKYHLPFPLIETLGLKTYRQFIVTTKSVMEKIKKVNTTADFSLIPIGIDPISAKITKNAQDIKNTHNAHILYIGRIEVNQKGLDLLIKAFAGIVEKTEKNLIIAGQGLQKDVDRLKHYIHIYGLSERVMYVGKVSGKTKDKLLRDAALVVIPSRFDTFALVALEAISYGKMLVGFNIEGLKWIPNEYIERVKRFDAKILGEKMLVVLQTTNHQKKITVKEKSFIKNYSWDTLSKNYKKTFISAMNMPFA